MLFPYTYVPHSMEKMQEFIVFIFFEVWCKAPAGHPFGFDPFNAKPDLKSVMEALVIGDCTLLLSTLDSATIRESI